MTPSRTIRLTASRAAAIGQSYSAFRAVPLSLEISLDRTRPDLNGRDKLRAEIRRSQTDHAAPLAAVELTTPAGAGPFLLCFTGAQTNHSLDARPAKEFWLAIITVDDAGETLDILHAGPLTLVEHGASLAAPAPPNPVGILTQSTADALYAPLATVRTLATQAEAEVGTDNVRYLSPLRAAQMLASWVGTRLAGLVFGRVAASALPPATALTAGAVRPDGVTLLVDQHGRLSAPPLQLSSNGSVQLSWDADGSLRADIKIS